MILIEIFAQNHTKNICFLNNVDRKKLKIHQSLVAAKIRYLSSALAWPLEGQLLDANFRIISGIPELMCGQQSCDCLISNHFNNSSNMNKAWHSDLFRLNTHLETHTLYIEILSSNWSIRVHVLLYKCAIITMSVEIAHSRHKDYYELSDSKINWGGADSEVVGESMLARRLCCCSVHTWLLKKP